MNLELIARKRASIEDISYSLDDELSEFCRRKIGVELMFGRLIIEDSS